MAQEEKKIEEGSEMDEILQKHDDTLSNSKLFTCDWDSSVKN